METGKISGELAKIEVIVCFLDKVKLQRLLLVKRNRKLSNYGEYIKV